MHTEENIAILFLLWNIIIVIIIYFILLFQIDSVLTAESMHFTKAYIKCLFVYNMTHISKKILDTKHMYTCELYP